MITRGTSHFVSIETAIRHYRAYQYPNTRKEVQRKIKSGEISIGKPEVTKGEKVIMIDTQTRYAIVSNK